MQSRAHGWRFGRVRTDVLFCLCLGTRINCTYDGLVCGFVLRVLRVGCADYWRFVRSGVRFSDYSWLVGNGGYIP